MSDLQDLKDIYKSQLHEQFATNYNSSLSSVIALIISMFGVLWAFGWVFLHSSCKENGCWCVFYNSTTEYYTIPALIIVSIATLAVLWIMFHICVSQGVIQRRDQLLMNKLREEVGLKLSSKDTGCYTSEGKNWWNFVPGLFGGMAKILVGVAIVVFVVTLLRIMCCCNSHLCCYCFVYVIAFVGLFGSSYWRQKMKYNTYFGTFKMQKDSDLERYSDEIAKNIINKEISAAIANNEKWTIDPGRLDYYKECANKLIKQLKQS